MRRFDFSIGAKIYGEDGECGQLTRLVVDPTNQQVTGLILERGVLLPHNHIIPISLVQSASNNEVRLSIRSDEVDEYPAYRVIEYEEPVAGLDQIGPSVVNSYGVQHTPAEPTVPLVKRLIREGLAPGDEVLEKGMRVNNIDGPIGKLDHVLVEPDSDEITHLVVKRGLIFSEQLLIPFSMVVEVNEQDIFVDGDETTVAELPRFTSETEAELLN